MEIMPKRPGGESVGGKLVGVKYNQYFTLIFTFRLAINTIDYLRESGSIKQTVFYFVSTD